ncbi:hypothetical protein WA171_000977 [Blastocystis sp. BT1]
MAPRGSRRQQYTDDYTDESDSSSCKKRRKEKVKEETELEPETKKPSMEDLDVKSAMEALQKQRDDSLLLIKTEHQMRLDSANKLATFEEERLNEFYEHEVAELKRKIEEERVAMSKRAASEGIHRKHRMLPNRNEDHSGNQKKEDTTLTVALPDNEVIDDIRYMVTEWHSLCEKYHLKKENLVVILPGSQLVVNDQFIAPGMELTLQNGELRIHGQFISAEQKEFMFKPDKEKRKKFSLDLVRDGSISFLLNEKDVDES